MEKIRLCKEDKIADMPLYAIYLVAGEGYVVANKITRRARVFKSSYLEVLEYANSIN